MVDTLLDEKGYKVLRQDIVYQGWEEQVNLAYCSDGRLREYSVSEFGKLHVQERSPETGTEIRVMGSLLKGESSDILKAPGGQQRGKKLD
jgi:hypothetical protein